MASRRLFAGIAAGDPAVYAENARFLVERGAGGAAGKDARFAFGARAEAGAVACSPGPTGT